MIGITGAGGVLGRLYVQLVNKYRQQYTIFKGDVRELNAVSSWIEKEQPDEIVHLAAKVPIDEVNSNPIQALDTNAIGTLNLLKALYKYNRNGWLLLASTSHVYKSSNKLLAETDSVEPQNLYARTKYIAEQIADYFMAAFSLRICIARIFSFYHPTQRAPFLYPVILQRLAGHDVRKPFEVRNGEDVRDILNAEVVVGYLERLRRCQYIGKINIGSGVGISIAEFANSLAGPQVQVVSRQENAPTCLVANIEKLKRVLNG